jgi:hypothetical protein
MGTLQLGLEILTNMYAEDLAEDAESWGDDQDEAMEEDGAENDDEDDLAEMHADEGLMQTIAGESGNSEGNSNGESGGFNRFNVLTSHDLLSKTLRLCASASISFPSDQTPLIELSTSLAIVRLRAFGCLNNLLASAADGGWYETNGEEVLRVWNYLFEVTHAAASSSVGDDTHRLEVIEAAMAAMWALARGVDGLKQKTITIIPAPQHVQALISSTSMTNVPDSLKVKCVGILSIIGKAHGVVEVNRSIGTYLIQTLKDGSSAEVFSESLNAIYDIYADEAFDYDLPVFVQGGFLNALKEVYPALRNKVKGVDKRRMKAVRERADEAMHNLKLFIQYKENEMVGILFLNKLKS